MVISIPISEVQKVLEPGNQVPIKLNWPAESFGLRDGNLKTNNEDLSADI
jgi:hypothetical protein